MIKCHLIKHFRARAGQAVVLLLAILMAMVALSFWIFDTHLAVFKRIRAQDAGDPAVLAAARWQAAGLNLCGELNLIHAFMLADSVENIEQANALFHLQQRIALITPILSLQAAQVVAQKNDVDPIEEAREFLLECIDYLIFDDFYEGATEDFRDALRVILNNDIYAFPAYPGPPEDSNLLCNQDFYEAILADDYCWFWFNAPSFLENYRPVVSFGRLPELKPKLFFDLSLRSASYSLMDLRSLSTGPLGSPTVVHQMNQQMNQLGHPSIPPPSDKNEVGKRESKTQQTWMVYGGKWHNWEQMQRSVLPIRSELKPEFDTFGATAAVTIIKDDYPWMCAAKPFGSIDGEPMRPGQLVLGGFKDVRLIPIDSVDAGRPFDPEWLRHLYHHITYYYQSKKTFENCRYCRALYKLDNTDFCQDATLWLDLYGHTCRRPKPGRGDSGGINYAH